MEVVQSERSGIMGIITLLKNKRIIINPKIGFIRGEIILEHTSNILNERACGAQYEESGWDWNMELQNLLKPSGKTVH